MILTGVKPNCSSLCWGSPWRTPAGPQTSCWQPLAECHCSMTFWRDVTHRIFPELNLWPSRYRTVFLTTRLPVNWKIELDQEISEQSSSEDEVPLIQFFPNCQSFWIQLALAVSLLSLFNCLLIRVLMISCFFPLEFWCARTVLLLLLEPSPLIWNQLTAALIWSDLLFLEQYTQTASYFF